jgi:hypothetical protein
MADAQMADAEAAARPGAAPAKKGVVDYAALEADVQAQLQVAAQVRAPQRALQRLSSPNNGAALAPRRAASPRLLKRCSTSRRRSVWCAPERSRCTDPAALRLRRARRLPT